MKEAANFLNAIMEGNTLSEAKKLIKTEIDFRRQELDTLARDLVQSGLALWEDTEERHERLIVKGKKSLNESSQKEDLDKIKNLFDDLERKRDIADFLELTEKVRVRIFIGSENKLSLTDSSLVVSPYMNSDRKIIGAVGVIGPTD